MDVISYFCTCRCGCWIYEVETAFGFQNFTGHRSSLVISNASHTFYQLRFWWSCSSFGTYPSRQSLVLRSGIGHACAAVRFVFHETNRPGAHSTCERIISTMLAGRAFQGVCSGVILSLVEIVLSDLVPLSEWYVLPFAFAHPSDRYF